MNNARSEFIIFGNKILVNKCISSELNINGETIIRFYKIRSLGA